MTPAAFRKLACSLPGAVESAHCGHPDFRVCGKVFASLGAPSDEWGVVKLTPEQQQSFVAASSDAFQAHGSAWGRSGWTLVRLAAADRSLVGSALELAAENVAAKLKQPSRARQPAKPKPKLQASPFDSKLAAQRRKRVVAIVKSLPEASAMPVGDGHLSLEVRGKRLGYFLANHHGDGRLALNLKADAATSRKLVERSPSKFHIPKYVGRHGWLGIWIDGPQVDWDEVRSFLIAAYRMAAPRKVAASLK